MARRYSNPVTQAIFLAGQSFQRGYDRLSRAHMSAADFALQEAKQGVELREFEQNEPIRAAERRKAEIFLEKQDFLDAPMQVDELFPTILGQQRLPHQIDHIISNDIPGKIMDTLGATVGEDNVVRGPKGKPLTRRRLQQYAPVIVGLIDSQTAPEKIYQDELDYLREKSSKARLSDRESEVLEQYEKLEKNPAAYARHFMKAYHNQEARLIDLKANLIAMGADTTVVDDALRRNARISGEMLEMLKIQKTLEGRQLTLRPGITQKDVANIVITATKNADSTMQDLDFEGAFDNFQGTGEPFTPEQKKAYRDRLIQEDVIRALQTANALTNYYGTPTITVTEKGGGDNEGEKPPPETDRSKEREKQKKLIAEGQKAKAKKEQAKKQEQNERLRRSQDAFRLIREAMQ